MSCLDPAVRGLARRRLLTLHHESRMGHVGGALSCIDAILVLFHGHLGDRDEFVLSKGHAVTALYTALWSVGVLDEDALQTFALEGTALAAHPPIDRVKGINFATGSLGHGVSLAAGSALGARFNGEDSHVFCLTSDGEWQEGSTWEALAFAVHHQLENLTVLIDDNGLQAFGRTREVAALGPLGPRIRGFGVAVDEVDGHDVDAIDAALALAVGGPRVIVLRTVKGSGVESIEDRLESHYLPLDDEQYRNAVESERFA